ncbi:MAG: 50S ribosomal protein L2 [Waddliaceae bacterium]|jgi:large subunit ribosomal protein L2|nr:50S ribosomal protein L2 [Waddliaceae bacterium]MBT3578657.1 50S ribosomal protein L2 [Waddliaceae bacterium]MBT4445376.1 50S ribosomal protein L2 [Waddliaceae bacterium]MBT6928356.1 50S ribosomal protein L2 [Waddliaceae bacterium]MBT7265042.1 50S ribosomal protein L2 [Waddliaceae bacterium]
MPKKYRPTTPSMRQLVLPEHKGLTRKEGSKATVKPTKSLLLHKKRTSGRNNHGHITCRHRGGGHKRHYRCIDFKRDKFEIPAKVASIEYDPNRTAHIALLNYKDGEKRYIIAPHGLKAGDMVMTSDKPPFRVGNCMKLKHMPIGSTIHNIEMYPTRGAQLVRSAGLSAQLMGRNEGYATIRMPSGEVRLIKEDCMATFGTVSNAENSLRVEGKAGRMRWKGIRPTVRGTVMNPVDHPHGGGEGRHNGYLPKTPWGQHTKGFKTRKKKNRSDRFIVKDRRKK